MLVPLNWLRAVVPAIGTDTRAFLERITETGTKVEGLSRPGFGIDRVVTGRVLSIEKHPDADKLVVTKIDVGERTLQIVTGARNLTVGDCVPVAQDGAVLAEGRRIKTGKLRGVVSEGMLCDITELGYTRDDYPEAPEDGIYIFGEPQPLGADVKPILQLTDEVVDFEIMSNRPDCNSILGVAREAAAAYGERLPEPVADVKETAGGHAKDFISVEIQSPDLCPRYIARVVKNAVIGTSPLWLRHRLTACGIRPINTIVDITNYVMLETGQPMHAFDIDCISGGRIIVRNARAGEVFTTLDGSERVLDGDCLVIADPDKAVAVAGVMGGANSMITGRASAILFESATFHGPNIRRTSKKLGLRTDASARYEKGLDPQLALTAVNRAMELIGELGCGEAVPGCVDAYPAPRTSWKVPFSPERINALIGIRISAEEMAGILSRLGIETQACAAEGEYEAEIPTRRADITMEADIAEEVARFYGYSNVPSRRTQQVPVPGCRPPKLAFTGRMAAACMALGYHEALTYPFESAKAMDRLLILEGDPLRDAIRIQNPLGEDFALMRTTTVNGLLESLSTNLSRRCKSARLFEAAYTYRAKALPLTALPDECHMLTLAAYDKAGMDFFTVKGDVEELLAAAGLGRADFAPASVPYLHPGRAADVSVTKPGARDAVTVGFLGELHPQAAENYGITERAYVAVLSLDMLFALSGSVTRRYKPLPKFPAVQRDLALTVKADVAAGQLETAIRERGGQFLADVELFDVYQGPQVADGYKSVAFTLTFRAADRTLADADLEKPLRVIRAHLVAKHGAALRE